MCNVVNNLSSGALLHPNVYSSSSSTSSSTQPNRFAFILDVDGVINSSDCSSEQYKKTIAEMFPSSKKLTQKQALIALAHCFNENAVNNLNDVIEQIQKTHQVVIVISSNWRKGNTVEELKGDIFRSHKFAQYIIDKTSQICPAVGNAMSCSSHDLGHRAQYYHELGHESLELCLECQDPQCRSSEIRLWLKKHPEICNYVILDDCFEEHLTKTFGNKFVHINRETLLTVENCKNIFARIATEATNFYENTSLNSTSSSTTTTISTSRSNDENH